MPRKMAGIAMMTMEPSIVAIIIVSVVFDSAIHLYRSDSWPDWPCCPCGVSGDPDGCGRCLDVTPTEAEFTFRRLLAGNHLPCPRCLPRAGSILSGTNHNDTPVRHR